MARKQEMIEDEIEAYEDEEEREERQPRRDKVEKRRPVGKRQDVVRKSPKSQNKIIRYFQETREELRKVAWPTRQEAVRLTLIVLGATLAFAIIFGLLDLLFQQLAGLLV